MSTGVPVGVLVLTLLVSTGCALHHRAAGGGEAAPKTPRDGAAPVGAGFATTLEASDPILAAALLEVAIVPSAAQHQRIATRYRELGILDAAYDHFARARDIEPNDAAAYDGLARVWRDWGFPQRGLSDAGRSVFFAPTWAVAHNTLGTILAALGRGADARRSFDRARTLDASAAYALNNLCYLSFLEGQVAQAFAECRAALDVDPGMAAARNNLALVYAAAQRDDLAQREFLAAGDAAAAAYNIGLVHMAEGRYAVASKAFDAASRQRPSWSAARQRASKSRSLAARAGDPAQ